MPSLTPEDAEFVDTARRASALFRERLSFHHHDGRGTLKSVMPSEPLKLCTEVVERAVRFGESGSLLIVGHAYSGKSTLVSVALAEVANPSGVASTKRRAFGDDECPFALVTIFGLSVGDELAALRSITRQLRLENVVGDRVFGSVSENLSFLLEALRGGQRECTRPVVFVLDQLETFCELGKQSLLYNLLDCTQMACTPICVIGMTRRFDVLELMEKRVRSRFSQRVVNLFPRHTLQQFVDISKRLLALEPNDLAPGPGRVRAGDFTRVYARAWSSALDDFLQSDVFMQCLKALFHRSPNFRALKSFLLALVTDPALNRWSLWRDDVEGTVKLTNALKAAVACAYAIAMGQGVSVPGQVGCDLSHLPVLELTLLVTGRRQAMIHCGKPFNFYTLFRAYSKFARETGASAYERSVMRKAFENLTDEGFFQPVTGCEKMQREQGVCKDYRGYYLAWGEDELEKHLKTYPSLPTSLQRWMSAPAVEGLYG